MQKEVFKLLEDAGIDVQVGARAYRPTITQLPNFDTKMFKPQNLLEMLHVGSRDLGFAGADWVANLGVEVTELLDTGLDPGNAHCFRIYDQPDMGMWSDRSRLHDMASIEEVMSIS